MTTDRGRTFHTPALEGDGQVGMYQGIVSGVEASPRRELGPAADEAHGNRLKRPVA